MPNLHNLMPRYVYSTTVYVLVRVMGTSQHLFAPSHHLKLVGAHSGGFGRFREAAGLGMLLKSGGLHLAVRRQGPTSIERCVFEKYPYRLHWRNAGCFYLLPCLYFKHLSNEYSLLYVHVIHSEDCLAYRH